MKSATNNQTESSKKMYLTAGEAKAMGLPSMDDQIDRWNEMQRRLREGA